jgi:hypothetical protein
VPTPGTANLWRTTTAITASRNATATFRSVAQCRPPTSRRSGGWLAGNATLGDDAANDHYPLLLPRPDEPNASGERGARRARLLAYPTEWGMRRLPPVPGRTQHTGGRRLQAGDDNGRRPKPQADHHGPSWLG